MDPDEFVTKALRAYAEARKAKYPCERVERGRSHSISAALEDLMACYLARNDTKERRFFVDQPIMLAGETRYPDVVIQNAEGEIENLVDMKTDPGWARGGLKDFASEWNERVQLIRQQGAIKFKSGEHNEERSATGFSTHLKYHIIFLTLKNGSKTTKEHFREVQNGMFPGVEIYCLTEGEHPNSKNFLNGKAWQQKIWANVDAFNRIKANLLF